MAPRGQFPAESTATGDFARQEDAFRHWVRADASTVYRPDAGRYHLYVSLACPWAHRTIIVRRLKRLESVIGMTVVDPVRDERGWAFRDGPGHSADPVNGFQFLSEAYHATDPGFQGRYTVPVLWDKQTRKIVNNSEDDICRMLHDEFARPNDGTPDLFPAALAAEQETLSKMIHDRVNNGVYGAGFATRQGAYERAVKELFPVLDRLNEHLSGRRYLFGDFFVETDWRLFCTLVRFDAVYYGHFKCNLRRILDYPNLQDYLLDLYQTDGIAETVNLDHIKRHYYVTHTGINPTQIVPVGPVLDFTAPTRPHRAVVRLVRAGRESRGGKAAP
jgi:putative glutathione S-transferase